MKKFIFYLFTILGICAGMVSCSDDKEDDPVLPPEVITLELKQKDPLTFDAAGGLDSVEVITNAEKWSATSKDKWIKLEKKTKTVVVQVLENDKLENRNTFIEVTTGSGENRLADTIFVKQAGQNSCVVSVMPKTLRFAAQSAEPQTAQCTFVLGNATDEVAILSTDYPNWITPELKNVNKEAGTADIVVKVSEYTSASQRMYDLIVSAGKGVRQDKDTIRIVQDGILPAIISYELEPKTFEATGGDIVLTVTVTPARAFTWRWEDTSQNWVSVDASQLSENKLKLTAGKGDAARSTALILEAPGASPVTVTITQKAAPAPPKDYKLGDIVNNGAGKAVGIVVKEKGIASGLIMSLKEYNADPLFSKEITPKLLNSKDGEVNTKAILETYDATDCPDLWAAVTEMNKDGETGWYLPSPDELWDAGEYLMGVKLDRTLTDQFNANYGTTAVMDAVQFNKVKRLITTAGGDDINLTTYRFTSMIGTDKYGYAKMYAMIWGKQSPLGALWGIKTYDASQVGKLSNAIRLFKKF